jgi:predicted nucleic acid-binding protein
MNWWDTSALMSLLAKQQATDSLRELHAADNHVYVWWGTAVEGASAIAQLQRRGLLRPAQATRLAAELEEQLAEASEVPPSQEVRATACRLLRVHALTAADALQLAAALVWVEHQPNGAGFVCLDRRLCEAAAREGFRILPEE